MLQQHWVFYDKLMEGTAPCDDGTNLIWVQENIHSLSSWWRLPMNQIVLQKMTRIDKGILMALLDNQVGRECEIESILIWCKLSDSPAKYLFWPEAKCTPPLSKVTCRSTCLWPKTPDMDQVWARLPWVRVGEGGQPGENKGNANFHFTLLLPFKLSLSMLKLWNA